MTHILALDQGTTSSRAIVFEPSGRIAGIAQQEFEQIYPQAGWVEHDPRAIIDTQMSVALTAIKQASVTARDIAAIGITNQRETTVLWDRRTGKPVANAIVWQDRRTADLCESLRESGAEDLVRAKTGLVIDPYFSASKIRWMLDHLDGVRDRAERGELAFGTVDSWLIWHLSEGRRHVTDATNASRTMLYDIRSGEWDEELLSLWKIPRSLLPEVCDTSGISAMTTRFGGELPVAGIAGDQQAALFGQACFEPGMAKCTYGTGCFILMATGGVAPVSERGLLTTIAGRSNGVTEYALEGSVFMGGATVQWLRDGLGIIEEAADIETLAREVDDSDGVVLVPAFAGLGAPQWDPHARALLIGMTRGTTKAHIARAALEGIAWQVASAGILQEQRCSAVYSRFLRAGRSADPGGVSGGRGGCDGRGCRRGPTGTPSRRRCQRKQSIDAKSVRLSRHCDRAPARRRMHRPRRGLTGGSRCGTVQEPPGYRR